MTPYKKQLLREADMRLTPEQRATFERLERERRKAIIEGANRRMAKRERLRRARG